MQGERPLKSSYNCAYRVLFRRPTAKRMERKAQTVCKGSQRLVLILALEERIAYGEKTRKVAVYPRTPYCNALTMRLPFKSREPRGHAKAERIANVYFTSSEPTSGFPAASSLSLR